MNRKEEKDLAQRILKNEKKAKALFYKAFSSRLARFIKSKVSPEVSEEILDDVFLSAFDSLPLFKFNASLYSWLYSIARHEIVDFYRRRKIKTLLFSRLPFLENLATKALGPEGVLAKKELKEDIKKILRTLSEGYCKILRLKYIEGLSIREIAKILGKTVKATESKLFRARNAFQKVWLEN